MKITHIYFSPTLWVVPCEFSSPYWVDAYQANVVSVDNLSSELSKVRKGLVSLVESQNDSMYCSEYHLQIYTIALGATAMSAAFDTIALGETAMSEAFDTKEVDCPADLLSLIDDLIVQVRDYMQKIIL